MKRWRKGLVTAAAVLLVLALWGGMVQAKSYSIPEVNIQAEVLEDGRVRIEEHRTFSFSGSFSWLEQWIFKKGNSYFDPVYVSEGGIPYENNYTEKPYTYWVSGLEDGSSKVVIRWYYQAQDERRTFTVGYDAHQVVQVHEDTVELYYQFVGDDWEMSTGRVRVEVTLPRGVPEEEIRAWGHGPLHGEVIISGRQVFFEIDNLPRDHFLEGRILFPPEYLPGAGAEYRTGELALEGILEEEAALAQKANRRRLMNYLDWVLGPIVFLLIPGAIFFFWWKYGKEFKPDFEGDYYRELPADYSPAEMGVLYRFGTIKPEDLTATIMDLARRGYLKIEEGEERKTGLFKKGIDYRLTPVEGKFLLNLAPHEQELLNYLLGTIALGKKELNFSDIEAHAKKNPSGFQSFYNGWQSSVKLSCDEYQFFDPATKKGRTMEFILAGILFFLGFVLIFTNLMITGFVMTFGGVIMAIAAAILRRRSQEGSTQFAKWRAFRKFLLDFSQMDRAEIPSLIIWEHYLVYAISLGIAQEVIRRLKFVFPNLREGDHYFGRGWYYMPYGRMTTDMPMANISGMTSSLQQSFQSAVNYHPQSSSGSGGGGGFSGGGGGGFGGGGGRAG